MLYRMKNPGSGMRYRGQMRIVVGFDDETFATVRSLAVERNVSVAEMIRQLVEFGLIDLEEAA